MTCLSNYTTEELERLTTLTEATAKPGEFVRFGKHTQYRTGSRVVDGRGTERSPLCRGEYHALANERRVTSFTDATELDPPQAEMLAELARRKAPKPIEGVVYTMSGGWHYRKLDGKWQRKSDTAPASAFTSNCGSMVDWWWENGNLTPVTPQPKAPVFTVGELAMSTYPGWKLVRIADLPGCSSSFPTNYRACDVEGHRGDGLFSPDQLRPATDAEVAAYHRAHCQPKPAPVVISNATHAGQWVKWLGRPCKVLSITNLVFTPACGLIAVADEDGCVCHIRPNEAILIDPPTWPQ